jgi:hypothetical protein
MTYDHPISVKDHRRSRNSKTWVPQPSFSNFRHGFANGSAAVAPVSARANNFASMVYSRHSASHAGILCGEPNMPQGSQHIEHQQHHGQQTHEIQTDKVQDQDRQAGQETCWQEEVATD